jgi:hypothetical protein
MANNDIFLYVRFELFTDRAFKIWALTGKRSFLLLFFLADFDFLLCVEYVKGKSTV